MDMICKGENEEESNLKFYFMSVASYNACLRVKIAIFIFFLLGWLNYKCCFQTFSVYLVHVIEKGSNRFVYFKGYVYLVPIL